MYIHTYIHTCIHTYIHINLIYSTLLYSTLLYSNSIYISMHLCIWSLPVYMIDHITCNYTRTYMFLGTDFIFHLYIYIFTVVAPIYIWVPFYISHKHILSIQKHTHTHPYCIYIHWHTVHTKIHFVHTCIHTCIQTDRHVHMHRSIDITVHTYMHIDL